MLGGEAAPGDVWPGVEATSVDMAASQFRLLPGPRVAVGGMVAPLNPSYVLGGKYCFRTGGAFNSPAARAGRRPTPRSEDWPLPGCEKVTFLSIRVRSVTRAVGTAQHVPSYEAAGALRGRVLFPSAFV